MQLVKTFSELKSIGMGLKIEAVGEIWGAREGAGGRS